MNDKIERVACLWQWNPNHRDRWELYESFGMDCYNSVVTDSKLADDSREPWTAWTHKVKGDDFIPIPGRCVTGWTMEHGVFLMDFIPPGKWPEWIGDEFVESLRKAKDWTGYIDSGYRLVYGTSKAAANLLAIPA